MVANDNHRNHLYVLRQVHILALVGVENANVRLSGSRIFLLVSLDRSWVEVGSDENASENVIGRGGRIVRL